jgi:hypothetical protein
MPHTPPPWWAAADANGSPKDQALRPRHYLNKLRQRSAVAEKPVDGRRTQLDQLKMFGSLVQHLQRLQDPSLRLSELERLELKRVLLVGFRSAMGGAESGG